MFFVPKCCHLSLSFTASWSTSSSPVHSPSPAHTQRNSNLGLNGHYGTTSLEQRSRSPSPLQSKSNHVQGELERSSAYSMRLEFENFLFFLDYQQSYQLLQPHRVQGRILPATPNKPSILQIPQADVEFPELNQSPTCVSNELFGIDCKWNDLYKFPFFQFYKRRNRSIATPHSVHAFPHSCSSSFHNQKRNESFDYESYRPVFHDKEREFYERQVEFERELDKERFANSFHHLYKKI